MSRKQKHFEEYAISGNTYKLHLFDKIETQEESYMLGYMLGDGGFNKETHKRNARMFVSSKDEYIVNYFKNYFQPDNSIDSRIPVNNTRPEIKSTELSYRMTFSSKFTPIFKKYGILGIKEDRTFHNISKDKMASFLLGLFDADGYITWGKRKDRNRLWCNIGITHPSLKMLEKLQRFLLEELNITTAIALKGQENCYILRTGNMSMISNLIDFLYSNKPEIYNLRKYNNAISFQNEFIISNTYRNAI